MSEQLPAEQQGQEQKQSSGEKQPKPAFRPEEQEKNQRELEKKTGGQTQPAEQK
jgi:hypothetical protein